MQNNNKLKKFINKLTSTQRAQGALEYLLIIGVAILIVAVVIVALSGIITQSNDQNATSDYNNQMSGLKGLINLSRNPFEETNNLFDSKKIVKIEGLFFKQLQN